ncbi:hypothetical protein [Limosilactobacillus sp.]|uniref:hypothetical protein n=1 Tax=Limosilactobacillus sp. TaxID=2773925 RepID=UPI003F0ED40A
MKKRAIILGLASCMLALPLTMVASSEQGEWYLPTVTAASEKLDYQTITPLQTAAAIAYYGQKKIDKGAWRELNDFGPLGLTQLDNADHLAVKGRGNSWYLSPRNMNGGTSAAYTVGADGTVAFYTVKTVDQAEEHEPQATVNLHSIIQYVNQQHAVEQVKGAAQQIQLNK